MATNGFITWSSKFILSPPISLGEAVHIISLIPDSPNGIVAITK